MSRPEQPVPPVPSLSPGANTVPPAPPGHPLERAGSAPLRAASAAHPRHPRQTVVRSFAVAFSGIGRLAWRDRNFRFEFVSGIFAVALAVWLGLSRPEWAILVLTIALVLSAEALNTGVERAVDLASPQLHPLARDAKDFAAAGVLLAAIASVAVGLILFLPKLLRVLNLL